MSSNHARKLLSIIALGFMLAAAKSFAVGFGKVTIYSYLNEPLSAEIELIGVEDIDQYQLQVNLASPKDFIRASMARPFHLTKLKFEVVRVDEQTVIYVSSNNAITYPFLDFLLELTWPNGRLIKAYTILLDPPVGNNKKVEKNTPLVKRLVVNKKEDHFRGDIKIKESNLFEKENIKENIIDNKKDNNKDIKEQNKEQMVKKVISSIKDNLILPNVPPLTLVEGPEKPALKLPADEVKNVKKPDIITPAKTNNIGKVIEKAIQVQNKPINNTDKTTNNIAKSIKTVDNKVKSKPENKPENKPEKLLKFKNKLYGLYKQYGSKVALGLAAMLFGIWMIALLFKKSKQKKYYTDNGYINNNEFYDHEYEDKPNFINKVENNLEQVGIVKKVISPITNNENTDIAEDEIVSIAKEIEDIEATEDLELEDEVVRAIEGNENKQPVDSPVVTNIQAENIVTKETEVDETKTIDLALEALTKELAMANTSPDNYFKQQSDLPAELPLPTVELAEVEENGDELAVRLKLAETYYSAGDLSSAKELLNEIINTEHPMHSVAAKALLAKIEGNIVNA